jgi:hypothetical protein
MKFRFALLALLSCAFSAAFCRAQDTASITGTVHDPSGASIANAQVTVSSPDRGITRNTTTNSDGEYSVAALPPGSYNVTVSAPGFKKYEASGVILRVAQKARNDVSLQVGAATAQVTVEGTNVAQVDTQSSELAGTVTGKEITQLQLNGRNFTQLVTLAPGVSNQTGQDEGTVGVYGNVAYSFNGGRTEYNNWELDGGDNMDNGSNTTLNVYPSLESIAEFKVLTSNYGAQYGRNGSGTVEVETKSGTRSFHGNAYEFVRNDAFNARNYFQSTVPPYKKNDFGYTIGGPIFIPGHYNTDRQKTFFFWSQEWRRDRVPGQNFNSNVPSNLNRTGNFSDLCPAPGSPVDTATYPDCPVNPATATYFPNNTVPLDPNAQYLLPLIPAPNAGQFTYADSPVQPTNWREELVRLDHNINANQRLTFRYIHDSWDTVTPTPLWTNIGNFPTIQTNFKGPGLALLTRLTSTFSPTLLNEFVFSYTTDHIILNNTGAWQRPSGATFGDLYGGNGHGIIPGINLVGGTTYGNFGQDPGFIPNGPYNSNPTYTYRDNINKVVGRHNFQFGAYFVAAQKNELGGEPGAGSVGGYLTFNTNSPVSTGNPFADLLMGQTASFGQQDNFVKYYNRYKILEPYFQDDWRVSNKLTLNLGLRLSLFGTYREKYHQAFNFDPAHYKAGQTLVSPVDGSVTGLGTNPSQPVSVSNLPNGIVQCGVTAGVPVGCMSGHLFNPAPRIGFAYDPIGDGKMSIRGGYGIFFEHTNGNEANTESLENSPPLVVTQQQLNIVGYGNIGSGFNPNVQTVFPLSVNAIPTKAVWPYVQQWHFDIQREVARNTVAMISYVGSKGTHLARQTDYNQLYPVAANQNPYKAGESYATDPTTGAVLDCGSSFDQYGVPTAAATPSGVPIPYQTNSSGFPIGQAVNLGVAACGANPDLFRPYAGYSSITHLQDAASSNYNALQVSMRRNLGQLQLDLAYTYSHSIDDSSSRLDAGFVDSYHPFLNRASSSFDQRHMLTFSYVWDLPFFKNPGLTNKLLGGWQYSGITTFSTGFPFSAITAADNAGVGNGVSSSASFADRIGDPSTGTVQPPLTGSLQGFGPALFNPAAYATPRGLTFGDSGRNSLSNPSRTNFDMALFKHFAIKESMAFEFRAEAYNIFNHTQWGYLAGDAGSGAYNSGNLTSGTNQFGQDNFLHIATAHNPRILQLGLKFLF